MGAAFFIQKMQKERYLGMKDVWNVAQVVFAAVGGGIGWFFGELDGFFYALLAFVVIDYLTGVMCAIADRSLSSVVGAGHILDAQVVGSGDALRTAVIFFYISNEGVSLLENAAHIGLPVPEKLKDVLAQLHDREKGDGE